jgi:hypothetical protein
LAIADVAMVYILTMQTTSKTTRIRAALLIGLYCASCVGAEAPVAAAPAGDLRSRLSDRVIKDAVRAAIAEAKENSRRHEAEVLSADKYQRFQDEFHEAKVPDCLHPDALKRQPPTLGPITLQYLFAVPFVVLAKARGKCL